MTVGFGRVGEGFSSLSGRWLTKTRTREGVCFLLCP